MSWPGGPLHVCCEKLYPGGSAELESSLHEMSSLKVNTDRLLSRIATLGAIGATPEGGVRRLALGDADRDARNQVVAWMRAAGLRVDVDTIGNIIGTRKGTTNVAPVMTGSHVDTVANGGRLDGAYGVLSGIEVAETLNDAGLATTRPIAVCVFTNEEGARFQPDMMGSLVFAGGLPLEEALDTRDRDGLRLGDELSRVGYAGETETGSISPHAFVEVHIEQGPVLDREGLTIGAVENLQGISWTRIRIDGEANHAGTTPMGIRHDAGYCVGAIAAHVRELSRTLGGTQVGTVGAIDLQPNLINVIPGDASLTVDLRNTDDGELQRAERMLEVFLETLAESEGVTIETERLARFDPVRFDDSVVRTIEQSAAMLELSCRRMTSGAGHDAQMMARLCPAAMIFVPSIRGISHNPAEDTRDQDLTAGANVLLHTLTELAET